MLAWITVACGTPETSTTETPTDTTTDTTDTTPGTTPEPETGDSGTPTVTTTVPVEFVVTSPDMAAHGAAPCLQQMPTEFWCAAQGGTNLNPEIVWSGAPAGTVSFALTLDDASINFLDHWGVYNIDAAATSIPAAASGTGPTAEMPLGSEQTNPYAGSCSNGANTYRWRLFALDATIGVNVNDIADIEQFAQTHTLAVATMCHCPAGDCLTY